MNQVYSCSSFLSCIGIEIFGISESREFGISQYFRYFGIPIPTLVFPEPKNRASQGVTVVQEYILDSHSKPLCNAAHLITARTMCWQLYDGGGRGKKCKWAPITAFQCLRLNEVPFSQSINYRFISNSKYVWTCRFVSYKSKFYPNGRTYLGIYLYLHSISILSWFHANFIQILNRLNSRDKIDIKLQ